MDKIIIERHPSKIDKDGRRHYLIRAIPYQILSKRLSGSWRCTRLGSRSSPGSEQSASSHARARLKIAIGAAACTVFVWRTMARQHIISSKISGAMNPCARVRVRLPAYWGSVSHDSGLHPTSLQCRHDVLKNDLYTRESANHLDP